MTTRYIGITEFRRNMPAIARRSRTKKERFILQSRSGLHFELRPVTKSVAKSVAKKVARPKKHVYKKEFIEGLEKAIEESKTGRRYTLEEVEKHLGL